MSDQKYYIKKAESLINEINKKTYFPAAVSTYNEKFGNIKSAYIKSGNTTDDAEKLATRDILSFLCDIMRSAQKNVDNAINERIKYGIIKDANQARKTAAGNVFQQMFAYSLAKNIICGNITSPVIVVLSTKTIIDKYASITVDGESIKPDSDVVVYSDKNEKSPILNFSCKTSFRERAGQTYKWKLLCDLATCKCIYKEKSEECPATKYKLEYSPSRVVKTCFVTTDFYDEATMPASKALFSFFDHSYIAKESTSVANLRILSSVVDDINKL